MKNAKRWYIYLTSGISLQVFVWGLITLLRLFTSNTNQSNDIAFQFSIIIISLPIFVIHYRWAQKLSAETNEELSSEIRSLYFYSMFAAFLSPFLTNLYTLISDGLFQNESIVISPSIIAMLITAIGYALTYRQILIDREKLASDENVFFRRIYILIGNFFSLITTSTATTRLLIFTFLNVWKPNSTDSIGPVLNYQTQYDSISMLLVGLTSLVIFWKWLQRLLVSSTKEQASPARKIYLYFIVIVSSITTISVLTAILAGIFRKWMGLDPDGDIRRILPTAIVGGIIWAFHSFILNRDDAQYGTKENQLGIKIIYLYLVASVGLLAFVIGVGGNLNTVLSLSLNEYFVLTNAKESFAYFTAAIIAGFPTWILPWRILQLNAENNVEIQSQARRSVARKNYLYFFLFIAVMVILGSAISFVYQILLLFLGQSGDANLGLNLSNAIANSLIAGGILAYHFTLLKQDQTIKGKSVASKNELIKILVLDKGDGRFAQNILNSLLKDLPDLNIEAIGISEDAFGALNSQSNESEIIGKIIDADLIVGDWGITHPEYQKFEKVSKSVRESTAHKLIIPSNNKHLNWVGISPKTIENPVSNVVGAIKQYLEGEEIKESRGSGCLSIIMSIVAIFILLNIVEALFSF